MATATEAVRRLTVEATTRGVKEAAAATRDLGNAVDGVAVSSQKAERATQSMEGRLASIQRRYDAQYRAQQEQARVERDLAAAQAQGLITIQRRMELLSLAAEKHGLASSAINRETAALRQQQAAAAAATTQIRATVAATNQLAAANDNARFASANVAAQFQDVAVTAAMGMNPLMIALQQGTQLSSVLSTMQSPLRGLAAALGSLLNPTTLLTVGFVALGAAAIQWFTAAEDEADDASTALERHRKWLDSILQGYDDVAKAAHEAGEAARALPQGVVELELVRGLRQQAEEAEQLNRNIGAVRASAESLMEMLSLPSAPMAFGIDRDQMGDLQRQIASLQDIVFSASSTRAELEAAAVAAGNLFDATDNADVQDIADSFYRLTLQLIDLSGRTKETATALDGIAVSAGMSKAEIKAVASATDRMNEALGALEKIGATSATTDFARATEALNRAMADTSGIEERIGVLRAYEAALARIRTDLSGEMDQRRREFVIGGLSDRDAATTRILDDYGDFITRMREAGVAEDEVARATALMNMEIARSAKRFDELEAKAAEADLDRTITRSVKDLNRELEAFQRVSDRLVADMFPGEAARREAEELLSLLDRFGDRLDAVQRAAVEARIADQFAAAGMGMRELEHTTQTGTDNIKGLLGDIGSIAAGVFDGAKESVWDWVDAIVAAIGQIGQRLMAFGSEVRNADPVAAMAASAASAARAAPANYTGTAPSIGARGASGVGEIAASAIAASADLIRYTNQGATRNLHLSQRLSDAMTPVLQKLGLTMEVFSGGQPGIGSGGARVGSVRHDHGNAADVFFNQDGMRLNWSNPAHRPIFEQIISMARGQGVTGFGVGPGYMAEGSMHIGFGSPAVWGAGGKGANAQAWAVNAFNNPVSLATTGSVAANQNIAPVVAAPSAAGLGTSSGSGGTFQKFAGAAGALASGFASGYQTQNPLMGAISGGLGALGSGDPLAIGLGILGGFIGGIIGLKKAIDEARAELDKLRPEMETFFKVGAGEGVSSMAESLRQYTDQAKEYAKIADKARDFETLDRLREAVVAFEETLKGDFRLGFEATLASLSSGQGLDGELVQAQQAVLGLREELKAFLADAEFSGADVSRARQASIQQMLSIIGGAADELSDVAFEMERIRTVLPSVQQSLVQLGMDGAATGQVIYDRLIAAVTDLRKSFEEDLVASINELSGRGYLNEIAAAQERYNARLSDAAALGLDAAGAQEELALSLAAVLKNAGATTDEMIAFGTSLEGSAATLRGVFRSVLDSAISTLRQTLDAWRGFVDDVAAYRKGLDLNKSLSTLSPSDQLAAAASAFETTAAGARAGNRDAMGRLQSDATAYLEQAASFWSSSEQYAAIFSKVQATLIDVETSATQQIGLAEQQLGRTDALGIGMAAANDNLITLVQATEGVRAALDAYLGAGGTMETSLVSLVQATLANAAAGSATASSVQDVVGAMAVITKEMAALGIDQSQVYWGASLNPFGLGNSGLTGNTADVKLGTENKGFFQRVGDWFADVLGFDAGGWTGNMGTSSVAGVTHGQEFVVRAPYAGQNRAALEGLNSGRGWGGAGNDNSAVVAAINQNAAIARNTGNAMVAEMRAMRAELADVKEENRKLRDDLRIQGGLRQRATGT